MDNSQAKRDSRQVNPGGNDGDAMTLTAGELADIKEVVGRLYKKITELEINQKLERERDRAELAAWAQTNLIQTQLLGKQTAVIEILTTELKHSERLSQQSQTHSESLLTELLNLKKSSTQNQTVKLFTITLMNSQPSIPGWAGTIFGRNR